SEEAQLRRDVAAAGGEPEALDAMESAWCGPGRIMEDLVDVDAAWHSLARRLTLPQAEPLPAGPTSPGVRARSLVRSARVSIAPVFARAGRGIREGSQRTADLVVHAAAVARPRVRSAYAWTRHAASVCAAATARQLAAARDAAVAHRHVLRSGLVRRIGALLGLALVVGGVWAFVAHRPRTTPALAHHATTKPLSPH